MLTAEEPAEPAETGRLREDGGLGANTEDTAMLSGEHSPAEQMLVSGPAGDGTGLALSLTRCCPRPVPETGTEASPGFLLRPEASTWLLISSPLGGANGSCPSAALCLGR